jgi:NADPH-dependent curcumin reductase CurA
MKNQRIVLAARPEGEPKLSDFRFEEKEAPEPREGECLLETLFLSLDPYMRGRMSAGKSYAKPVEVGEVMQGGTVSKVIASRHRSFVVGDIVSSHSGWQVLAISDGKGLRKLDPSVAPISTALGVLGMPGMTAYAGLLTIGRPKQGETVVVAAATGPVGSAVGQIAKIQGARAVGIAGGEKKCRALREDLGFDVALDHRSPHFAEDLAAACPKGIDVYFENVGGAVWSAVLPLLNDFARVPLCGLVAHYNATALPEGPDRSPELMLKILRQRLTLRGFIVSDFADQETAFLRDMSEWVSSGKVRYLEDVVEGLKAAPEAFIGMLRGKNFGKLVVRVSPA